MGDRVTGTHLGRRTVRRRLTCLYGALVLGSGILLLALTYLLMDRSLARPTRVHPGAQQLAHSGAAGIVRGTPPSTVQSQRATDLHQLLTQSGIALSVLAVLSLLIGWFIAGRVLRPLRTITATTRQISERNLHERLTVDGPQDELTELGDTIDGLLGRLDHAFDAQKRFVANASHELRTPLTLSRAMLEIALASPKTTLVSLRATCRDVLESNDRMERLVAALLTLARGGREVDRPEPFDLAELTSEVVDAYTPEALTRGVTIHTAFTPAPVLGDPELVRRLIANLVENALRHNVAEGAADVVVHQSDASAIIQVTNTGQIVAEDQTERLQEPFQRLQTDRSADREGDGLGLSIVRTIADVHNASLTICARQKGGLQIEIRFPGRDHYTDGRKL